MRKHLYHLPQSVRHSFGFPFWHLTKRRDDIAVADMVVDMVAEMEMDMVADMEVDKLVDMVQCARLNMSARV